MRGQDNDGNSLLRSDLIYSAWSAHLAPCLYLPGVNLNSKDFVFSFLSAILRLIRLELVLIRAPQALKIAVAILTSSDATAMWMRCVGNKNKFTHPCVHEANASLCFVWLLAEAEAGSWLLCAR